MKQFFNHWIVLFFAFCFSFAFIAGCDQKMAEVPLEGKDRYDGPDKAIEFEIERTHDLSTGQVPWQKLYTAIQQTEQAKRDASNSIISSLTWLERGPDGDFPGPQGNGRQNNDQTGGRIRAAIIDSLDPTHKTVWVGGVDGGLWKTTDITAFPATWTLINDFLSNLAVSAICQDPRPGFQNIMYFCTGESFSNADAVRGVGVFKSTDAGATWNFLPSTSSYVNGTRILCDYLGNVYLGTRNTGLLRSTDGGTTWTAITPNGIGTSVCDLEISSTSGPGRLHVTTGIFSTSGYRYADNPETVTAAGWTTPATPFTTFNQRTELGISGNTLYALPDNASHQVPSIWKSTDGGANWAITAGQPAGNWANGQGWYDLSCGINPANPNECIVGGVDCYKTTDGGATWPKVSAWVTGAGSSQYVHADQHNIQWWDGGTKLMFTSDGGVFYSSNGGTTIRDRNKGLRLKQFYSIAIHPTMTNHFIAGAQDNGVHRLNHPGLDSSIEVYGGDGCYVAIDQNEPQYQFGSYVYNVYRRSTNNGNTWNTPVNNQATGRFVNPWDYDNNTNIIYACNSAGNYLRWDNPQTGNTTTVIPIAEFGTGNVSAVHASPYTPHRVYFGLGVGPIVRVDNANTATPTATVINTGAGMPAGYVNCVVTGSDDQHLLATFTNYGVQNVWVSTNGGTSWTAIDGNLPDMPVRWALFHPDDDNRAFIATETGVWETDLINGGSTVWTTSSTFPTVRTDMIKYRSSDRTIAAGTHGRGIWTATVPLPCTPASITTNPSNSTICSGANTTFSVVAAGTAPLSYQWQVGTTGCGGAFTNISNGGVYSGATTATLTITGGTSGMSGYGYRCVVTGNCAPLSVTTTCATLTVNAATVISLQPANASACAGTNTSFSITATGSSLTYKWQLSTDGGTIYNDLANGGVYSGVTTPVLNLTGVTAGMNNYRYRCVLTSACATSATSNAAVLTVNIPVGLTSDPANATICATGSVNFSVTTTGSSPIYQWQESTAGAGGPWNNINNGGVYSGAATATLSLTGVAVGMNNYRYRCVVNGPASCGTGTSASALLTVTTQPTVSLSASPYTRLLPGLTTTISASVNPPAGFTTVWTWNGTPITPTGNTYNVNVNRLGTYVVVATIGTCTSLPATIVISDSASSKLWIYPSPNNGLFTVIRHVPGASSSGMATERLTIYGSDGRLVYDKELKISQPYQPEQVDLRRNGSDIYYVVLRDASGKKIASGEVVVK